MLDRLKGLFRKLSAGLEGDRRDEFDVDHPPPQRANPDPPPDDWFSRVRSRSYRARASAETKALDAVDAEEPRLSGDAARDVDALLARSGAKPR
jgi:hypothetical protein